MDDFQSNARLAPMTKWLSENRRLLYINIDNLKDCCFKAIPCNIVDFGLQYCQG